ncbi:Glycerophosphocholine phosphodiesterase [Collariella sp. IMI 366227]|nr:Glycerophosphocholine phosphodiesterase [Collariella sp. IMI 366227]
MPYSLPRNQVPEWAGSYINYKGLKKLIKLTAKSAQNGEPVDLAEFFFELDRNLEDVDSFYNKKFADASRRLKTLQDRYGNSPADVATLDDDEIEELMGALLELRDQLRKLQWFGEINRRGFVKITKKLDKKVPNTVTQHRYISTKVDTCRFATDTTIARLLGEINRWISVLGKSHHANDARSERSALSLGRASAKAMLSVPSNVLEQLDQAIRSDDVNALESKLAAGNLLGSERASQRMLLNLLQRSISARSKRSITFLLDHIVSLDEPDDINERNCIHRLVIHIGRTKTASSKREEDLNLAAYPLSRRGTSASLLSKNDEAIQTLIYLLDTLKPEQRAALKGKDGFGRIPLHYAAQFGFVVVCQILMKKMQEWGQFSVEHGIDATEWQDKDGNAPVHLSVLGGHVLTTKALLQGENWQGGNDNKAEMRRAISKSSVVLNIATKANSKAIVEMLVDAGVDINWQDKDGETALHIAARFGHDECARVLLKGTAEQKANLELAENSYAWTPLHVAAVDGHLPVAQLLVDAGADVGKLDSSGWTAKEHAALRGHLPIARLFAAHSRDVDDSASDTSDGEKTPKESVVHEVASLGDRRSNGSSRPTEPVKTFGHRYLKDESMVLVSLGTMDIRKSVEAVTLDRVPLAAAHSTQLDTALSIVVSAQGAHGEPAIIDMPLHENISTEPIVFMTEDPAKVRLLFDIVPTYAGNENNKVGRAVALLASIKPALGDKRANLQADVCVPIMDANFEVIGTVNFNFLVVKPFSHPNMEVTSQQTYWKKMTSTMVIGHRGLGKNLMSNRSLQLGENTVPSFIAAANLGAQYVEFDVQLTKDHVPVIYHDFLVSETGFDAPVHTQRSMSMDFSNYHHPATRYHQTKTAMEERMKHTRDFKAKGFKANSRGNFIQAPFATLEDLFRQLPPSVGFNIEMKYPMLHESEEHEMDAYAVELNSFCDTVLEKVYDHLGALVGVGRGRHVIFSSFNPDICLCLSFKQPNIPILFLTDAGTCEVGDIRASSLQEAIRFAARWNLLGIKQVKEGIDAVIVDSVLAIRKGLTGGQEVAPTSGDGLKEKLEEMAVSDDRGTNGNGNGVVNGNGVKRDEGKR